MCKIFEFPRPDGVVSDEDESASAMVATEMLYLPGTFVIECPKDYGDIFGARFFLDESDPVLKRFVAASGEAVGYEMAEPAEVVKMSDDHFRTSWAVNGYTVSIERSAATNDKVVFELDLGV